MPVAARIGRAGRVGLVLAAGLAGGGTALALGAGNSGGVITACVQGTVGATSPFVPLTIPGNVRIIDPSEQQACTTTPGSVTRQHEITWNNVGAQGVPGAIGANGRVGATGPSGPITITMPTVRPGAAPIGGVQLNDGNKLVRFKILSLSVLPSEQRAFSGPGPAGGVAGNFKFGAFVIRKTIDQVSPVLFRSAAVGSSAKSGLLLVQVPSETGLHTLTGKLTDVSVPAVQDSANELEEVAFEFKTISITWVNGGISTSDSWAAP
jgi:type VI protein secretion system component Hcp